MSSGRWLPGCAAVLGAGGAASLAAGVALALPYLVFFAEGLDGAPAYDQCEAASPDGPPPWAPDAALACFAFRFVGQWLLAGGAVAVVAALVLIGWWALARRSDPPGEDPDGRY